MTIRILSLSVLIGLLAFVGCVTVESTRRQLESGNPELVSQAEDNIFKIATSYNLPVQERIDFVRIVKNNDLLIKIIRSSNDRDVICAAADEIDFSKKGTGRNVLEILEKVGCAMDNHTFAKKFTDRVLSTLDEYDLCDGIKSVRDFNMIGYGYHENPFVKRLIDTTKDVELLRRMYDGDLKNEVDQDGHEKIVLKLAALADKLDDPKLIVNILKDGYNGNIYVNKAVLRQKLLSRLSDDNAVQYVLNELEHHNVYLWGEGRISPFVDAAIVARTIHDQRAIVKIESKVLECFGKYEKYCKEHSWNMRWSKEDIDKARKIIKVFPKLADTTLVNLICANETNWGYFIDIVSPNVAYDVIASGKANSVKLEEVLVKKLPKDKMDMKILNGARFAETRKMINESMSPEMKKAAIEEAERAFNAICEKAQVAVKTTWALDGFYLGMSFDDMKVVFMHDFPDLAIKEAIDGEGKDADYVIYVPGQQVPFCYANVKDKKVYQFDFGKILLRKWYRYDAQKYADWAHAYGHDMKIDIQYTPVKKDTTVYEPLGTRSYRVWFLQESWQYKNNTKGYRLTYFGEQQDFTVEGGLGGQIIKEAAASHFRYVRGDPGSLRIKIEHD